MVVVVGLTIVYVQDLNRGPALKKQPDIEKETCLKVRKGGFGGGGGGLKSRSAEPQKSRFETIAHA